jgi:hypothetical protein
MRLSRRELCIRITFWLLPTSFSRKEEKEEENLVGQCSDVFCGAIGEVVEDIATAAQGKSKRERERERKRERERER